MQVETLKMYRDLVECKSFTRAAEQNSVTTSAVSQQLTAMERLFQSTLIVRSKSIFRLTPQGKVVYKYSRTITNAYATMRNRVRKPKPTGG